MNQSQPPIKKWRYISFFSAGMFSVLKAEKYSQVIPWLVFHMVFLSAKKCCFFKRACLFYHHITEKHLRQKPIRNGYKKTPKISVFRGWYSVRQKQFFLAIIKSIYSIERFIRKIYKQKLPLGSVNLSLRFNRNNFRFGFIKKTTELLIRVKQT